jgi:hypothetical protein
MELSDKSVPSGRIFNGFVNSKKEIRAPLSKSNMGSILE